MIYERTNWLAMMMRYKCTFILYFSETETNDIGMTCVVVHEVPPTENGWIKFLSSRALFLSVYTPTEMKFWS